MAETITRRGFLKTTAAAVGAGSSLLLKGCASNKDFDLVVKGGLIVDGTGAKPFAADLGIKGGTIASMGSIFPSRGVSLIEATGLVVCPGFIDVHTHTDAQLLANPKAESAVRQGITTLISGNCGSSPFPLTGPAWEEAKANLKETLDVDLDWQDITGFLTRLEKAGVAVNYATLVGHGSVRAAAMGFDNRPPEPAELDRMKQLVDEAMKAGAFGLSSGLEYTPGCFGKPEELTELCRVVAGRKGVYATHMRNEGDKLLESLDESISTAREAGVSLQISHFKTADRRNWSKAEAALARVESARREGLNICCDRYPYVACSTGLSFYFPEWVREGTTEQFLTRLKDRRLETRIRGHLAEAEKKLGSWKEVVLCSVVTQPNKWVEGLSVQEAARRSGRPPFEFMRDLIVQERDRVEMVAFNMIEENLKKFLAHPLVGVGTDGSALAPYGPLGSGKPHPRSYGTFARVLGKYVRDGKILPLESMVKKVTFLPARKFGLNRRGVVAVGSRADLVVFDADKVADVATWANPHRYPAGIPYVIVNGHTVVDRGEHTGVLPGRILRKA